MELFTYDLKRRQVLCWKCPFCPHTSQRQPDLRKHIALKHLRSQTPVPRDTFTFDQVLTSLPPTRHYVLSEAELTRRHLNANHKATLHHRNYPRLQRTSGNSTTSYTPSHHPE